MSTVIGIGAKSSVRIRSLLSQPTQQQHRTVYRTRKLTFATNLCLSQFDYILTSFRAYNLQVTGKLFQTPRQ